MVSYVYMRINNINGKYYIGKANNPRRRWTSENNLEVLKAGRKSLLERAIKKHGKENFTNLIIATCKDSDEAYKVEEELITICRATQPEMCYNLNNGGKGQNKDNMSGEKNPMYGCCGELAPAWGNNRVDKQGGMVRLMHEKYKGKTQEEVAVTLGYTQRHNLQKWLRNRNLKWRDI